MFLTSFFHYSEKKQTQICSPSKLFCVVLDMYLPSSKGKLLKMKRDTTSQFNVLKFLYIHFDAMNFKFKILAMLFCLTKSKSALNYIVILFHLQTNGYLESFGSWASIRLFTDEIVIDEPKYFFFLPVLSFWSSFEDNLITWKCF